MPPHSRLLVEEGAAIMSFKAGPCHHTAGAASCTTPAICTTPVRSGTNKVQQQQLTLTMDSYSGCSSNLPAAAPCCPFPSQLVAGGVFQEEGITQLLLAPGLLGDGPGGSRAVPGCSGTRNLSDNLSDLKAQVAGWGGRRV